LSKRHRGTLRQKQAQHEQRRGRQLARILERLRSYHGENLERDIVDFAHAEAFEEDPLKAARLDSTRKLPSSS